jgi:hypothetical protein
MTVAGSKGRPLRAIIGIAIVALAGLIGQAALFAGGVGAETFASACGVISEHEMAKAFGHTEVVEHSSVLRAPGNSAGDLHIRCHVLAWSGRQPFGAKQEHRQLVAGEASTLRLETWVADEGPGAETWRANFDAKIQALTSRARKQFIGGLPSGKQVALPTFGTEHSLGFIATTGSLVKVRAFWWSAAKSSIVSMSAVEAKGSPLVSSIELVAASVVPEIH